MKVDTTWMHIVRDLRDPKKYACLCIGSKDLLVDSHQLQRL